MINTTITTKTTDTTIDMTTDTITTLQLTHSQCQQVTLQFM